MGERKTEEGRGTEEKKERRKESKSRRWISAGSSLEAGGGEADRRLCLGLIDT